MTRARRRLYLLRAVQRTLSGNVKQRVVVAWLQGRGAAAGSHVPCAFCLVVQLGKARRSPFLSVLPPEYCQLHDETGTASRSSRAPPEHHGAGPLPGFKAASALRRQTSRSAAAAAASSSSSSSSRGKGGAGFTTARKLQATTAAAAPAAARPAAARPAAAATTGSVGRRKGGSGGKSKPAGGQRSLLTTWSSKSQAGASARVLQPSSTNTAHPSTSLAPPPPPPPPPPPRLPQPTTSSSAGSASGSLARTAPRVMVGSGVRRVRRIRARPMGVRGAGLRKQFKRPRQQAKA